MRFGFFDQLPCAPGYSEPQRYKDILAQIELGDAVGCNGSKVTAVPRRMRLVRWAAAASTINGSARIENSRIK